MLEADHECLFLTLNIELKEKVSLKSSVTFTTKLAFLYVLPLPVKSSKLINYKLNDYVKIMS